MAPAPPHPGLDAFRDLLAAGNGGNVAVTDDGANDPRLRTRTFSGTEEEVRGRVIRALQTLPRWEIMDTASSVLWATRTTRLFRFVDDIYLVIDPVPGGHCAVRARSASRVGRYDFGQNRRNLAELWRALQKTGPDDPPGVAGP